MDIGKLTAELIQKAEGKTLRPGDLLSAMVQLPCRIKHTGRPLDEEAIIADLGEYEIELARYREFDPEEGRMRNYTSIGLWKKDDNDITLLDIPSESYTAMRMAISDAP